MSVCVCLKLYNDEISTRGKFKSSAIKPKNRTQHLPSFVQTSWAGIRPLLCNLAGGAIAFIWHLSYRLLSIDYLFSWIYTLKGFAVVLYLPKQKLVQLRRVNVPVLDVDPIHSTCNLMSYYDRWLMGVSTGHWGIEHWYVHLR